MHCWIAWIILTVHLLIKLQFVHLDHFAPTTINLIIQTFHHVHWECSWRMEEREKKETVAKVAVHPSYLKHRKIQVWSMTKKMWFKRGLRWPLTGVQILKMLCGSGLAMTPRLFFPFFPPPATCCSGTRDQQARKSSLGNLTALGAKVMLSDRLFKSLSSFLAAIFIFWECFVVCDESTKVHTRVA